MAVLTGIADPFTVLGAHPDDLVVLEAVMEEAQTMHTQRRQVEIESMAVAVVNALGKAMR